MTVAISPFGEGTLRSAGAMLGSVARDVFAVKRRMPASEWVERHFKLDPKFSNIAGRMRIRRTPFLRQPLDCISDPRVHELTYQAATQTAKTTLMNCMIAYIFDCDPGNLLIVYPTQDDAREVIDDRVLPALRAIPDVVRHFGSAKRDVKTMSIKCALMNVYGRGTNSIRDLEKVPAPWVIVDELDDCNQDVNVPEALRKRGLTFPTRWKVVKMGRPGDENMTLDHEIKSADDVRAWWVPCPFCGLYHTRYGNFSQVKWPAGVGANGERLTFEVDRAQAKAGAWFECPACAERIEGHWMHWQALHGIWLGEEEAVEQTDGGERMRKDAADGGSSGGSSGGVERAMLAIEAHPDEVAERPAWISDLSWDEQRGRIDPERGECGGDRLAVMERLGVGIAHARERPGVHVGMRVHGLDSTLHGNPYGAVSESFIASHGSVERDWVIRSLGEPWKIVSHKIDPQKLRALALPATEEKGYAHRTVPNGAVIVLVGADVQQDRVEYVIRAFGPGMKDTWLIDTGTIQHRNGDGLVHFDQICNQSFPFKQGGRRIRVMGAVCDSKYDTTDVYAWARRMRGAPYWLLAWPSRGDDSTERVAEVVLGNLDGSKYAIFKSAGLQYLKINSQNMTEQFYARISGRHLMTGDEASDELVTVGEFGLYEGVSEEYILQATALVREPVSNSGRGRNKGARADKSVFTHRPGFKHRDHRHDAERYVFGLAIQLGTRMRSAAIGVIEGDGSPVAPVRPAGPKKPVVVGRMGGRREGGGGLVPGRGG